MASNRMALALVLLLALLLSSSRVEGDDMGSVGISFPIGRSLLQAKTQCPVDFEHLNYTIITSQCKGPQYPPKSCCTALLQLACPYAEELNDLTNDCATTMFSYINIYGKYPPGLFASECKDSKRGLECSSLPPSANDHAASDVANGGIIPIPAEAILLVMVLSGSTLVNSSPLF